MGTISLSVDDKLEASCKAIFAEAGMTIQEALRIFMRQSDSAGCIPIPVNRKPKPRLVISGDCGNGLASFLEQARELDSEDIRDAFEMKNLREEWPEREIF